MHALVAYTGSGDIFAVNLAWANTTIGFYPWIISLVYPGVGKKKIVKIPRLFMYLLPRVLENLIRDISSVKLTF